MTRDLRLSESVAYNLIAVSRKVRQVPELGAELARGTITLSNAKRIAPVIDQGNKTEWLKKAAELSQRQLEKEVARVRPETTTPERASYVTATRVRLEVGLSERDLLRLRRVQDLLSQARRRPISLEETLVAMTDDHLRRHDPIELAKRQVVRKSPSKTVDSQVSRQTRQARRPIPRGIYHRVSLRDGRRCTYPGCGQTRWLEIHHKVPVSQGGTNELANLITLCSAHHGLQHA